MVEETITFELIRKIQREEQSVSKLTKLPEGFYKNVNSYFQQKRKMADKLGSTELKNIELLASDIFNRRERKILNMVLIAARTKIPPENLTEEEKVFFDALIGVVSKRRKEALAELLETEPVTKQEIEEVKIENKMSVVFNDDMEEFVGSDLTNYGPFKKGDTAEVPSDNAKLLMERGTAKEI
jgi:DNA replication factor GINS